MNARRILIWSSILLMLLFAFFQWNDPDPYLWIPIYLLVAFLGYRKLDGKDTKMTTGVAAFIYILWGISMFPPQWEGVMLNEMGMKTLNIELGRESLGMLIAALLLLLYTFLNNE